MRPRLSVVHEDGTTVVFVGGELDLDTRDDLDAILSELQGHVVLDFAGVTFLDSSAMGMLVASRKRLEAAGGDLRFRCVHDVPRRAWEVVGLTDWLDD